MRNFFRKIISLVVILSILSLSPAFATEKKVLDNKTKEVSTIIELTIGKSIMRVNGTEAEVDPGMDTVPVIKSNRTLLPVRTIIETVGGSVEWNAEKKLIILKYQSKEIHITIGSKTAYLDNKEQVLDVAPIIINERTMLPIRFIAESFGFDVDWNAAKQIVTITVIQDDKNDSTIVKDNRTLKTTTYNLNGVEFKMIFVEGGTFIMGSDSRESNQSPEHEVTLSSYLMAETEVTQALWNAVMGLDSGSNEYPIASVTKPECDDFVKKLNDMAHAAGIIPDDINFYLPTEAEWEFASKGGNLSKGYTYSGSNTLSEVGWTSNDGSSVHKVKQKKSNELGLYDMSGNVYEWVADYAGSYSSEAQTNPCNLIPSNQYIKRGGSFYYNDSYRFTSTYRYFYSSTDYTIGVRICLR